MSVAPGSLLIPLAAELPLMLDDGAGGFYAVNQTKGRSWDLVSVAAYRRWRWTGHLIRPLARVRGYGREYLVDVTWERAHRAGAPTPRVMTEKTRGCGCRKPVDTPVA